MIRTFVKSLLYYNKLKQLLPYELKMNRFKYAIMIEQWNRERKKDSNDNQNDFPKWRSFYQQEPVIYNVRRAQRISDWSDNNDLC